MILVNIQVPRSEIHVLDMSIDEGIKLIVSGGMVLPTREPVPFPDRTGSPAGTQSPTVEDTP